MVLCGVCSGAVWGCSAQLTGSVCVHGTVSKVLRESESRMDTLTVTVQPAALKTSTVGRELYGIAQPSWGVTALQRTVKDGHRSAVT